MSALTVPEPRRVNALLGGRIVEDKGAVLDGVRIGIKESSVNQRVPAMSPVTAEVQNPPVDIDIAAGGQAVIAARKGQVAATVDLRAAGEAIGAAAKSNVPPRQIREPLPEMPSE